MGACKNWISNNYLVSRKTVKKIGDNIVPYGEIVQKHTFWIIKSCFRTIIFLKKSCNDGRGIHFFFYLTCQVLGFSDTQIWVKILISRTYCFENIQLILNVHSIPTSSSISIMLFPGDEEFLLGCWIFLKRKLLFLFSNQVFCFKLSFWFELRFLSFFVLETQFSHKHQLSINF